MRDMGNSKQLERWRNARQRPRGWMSTSSRTWIEARAYHEAGHAVAAHVLGAVEIRATINRDQWHPHDPGPQRYRFAGVAVVESSIVAALAGPMAQERHAPGFKDSHDAVDDELVRGAGHRLADYRAETARLLETHWQALERVAAELLFRRVLDHGQIAALCGGARSLT
jgi:ATP-dependent Zn protease